MKSKPKKYGFWTKENCQKEALKFKKRSDFKKQSAVAYRKSIDHGWLTEITAHMPKSPVYSLEDAVSLAKSNNGRCLSKSFLGVKQKLKWQCENMHVWKATFDQLNNQKTWCDACFRELRRIKSKANLIDKLDSFFDHYKRAPKRREFDEWCAGNGSSSACKTYWGSFGQFLESNGYIVGKGIFGQSWREWEQLVGDILKELYPSRTIYPQFFDKKSRTIIDYYIPSLGIGIDAKTSNYIIEARNTQWKKYLKIYKKVLFICLRKDNSQAEVKNVEYLYASEVLKKIKNKKIIKRINFLLEKDDEYKTQMGLITKESIISEIQTLANELKRTPKMREYSRDPRFSNHTTISTLFGSWNLAVKEAGLNPRKEYSTFLTEKDGFIEFERAYNDFCLEYEREPTGVEFINFISSEKYMSWKQIRALTGKTFLEIIND